MKRLTTCLFCVLLTFFFSGDLNAVTSKTTPTIYNITISKMEFYNSDTATWVTVGEGDMTFDIASVDAGAVAGSYVSASAIPEGAYTKVRVTLSRNMTIKAMVKFDVTNAATFDNVPTEIVYPTEPVVTIQIID